MKLLACWTQIKNKIGREYEGYLIEGTYEEAQRVKEKI